MTNLMFSKIIYAYCVPTQSTVNNRSPILLRSGIHPSLHGWSDFRPSFPFFLKSKMRGPVEPQATEKVKVNCSCYRVLIESSIQCMQDYISQF